ncbi:MAG: protein-export membrane protein SecF [Candidatus Parcubacteria bacterium]|nr:MAG: protein-export membrane protein SecF [Candidatus Parcubacteria bacterium]
MDFIKYRYYFYFLSLILVIFGVLSFYLFNPNLGIDLVGGNILEIKTKADVPLIINNLKLKAIYYPTEEGYIIKSQQDLNIVWQEIKNRDNQSEQIKFESISSSLSSELRRKAFLMIVLVLLAIGSYVSFSFYKLKNQFSPFFLGFIVIITLFHDVIATTGFYIFLSKFYNFDLDFRFITALLIIAGFSVHDTIVVFDRLRENILKTGKNTAEIFNLSINQTLRRSIFTSLSTIISIVPLSILIQDLRPFILSIQIGIVIGTYSSIFLAAPLLYKSKYK